MANLSICLSIHCPSITLLCWSISLKVLKFHRETGHITSIYGVTSLHNFCNKKLVRSISLIEDHEGNCRKQEPITISPVFTELLPFLASVAQLDAPSDWRPGGQGFNPCRGWQHSFVEIDHEIFSTVILSLPLIQEGHLSVSGQRMCTILVNRLED